MEPITLIKRFRDYLIKSELKQYIAKIVLFGSHAKGAASAQSDVDILIFTMDGAAVEKALMDRVFDFMIEYNAPLEIVTSGIDDLFLSQDYFLYNVRRYGREIYSMEKDQIKTAMVEKLIELAEEYLESAREVVASNRLRLAADAGYNAAELAAKGLILTKQDDLPGSHGGVVSLFGQLYIKTNELEKALGRELNRALKTRNMARYKPDALVTHEDAMNILEMAETLIRIASEKSKEAIDSEAS